jgi:pimeloyl-ACP methyl ester carboxylesterase
VTAPDLRHRAHPTPSRLRRLLVAAGALALGATVTACADDDAASPGTTEDASTTTTLAGPVEVAPADDLYALAEPLTPGAPGDVIAVQEVTGLDVDATVLRVLYHSQSIEGDDIAVSGLVAVPTGAAPDGGRPVLSWAHGTTGIADECAPSKDPEDAGLALVAPFLERGMAIVATDYEGLGTPGRHPYLAGESEGRGVLDIVRAARSLGDRVGASDEVVIWGHSQGGHAALFANQIAADYAPELEVVGTVAGAPPSQLTLIAAALKESPFRYYLAMVAAGWAAAYPDADPADVLTPVGLDRLDAVDTGCGGEIATAFGDLPYDELVAADPASVEPWKTLLVENDPGFEVGEAPILIIHGEQDEQIPLVSSELLLGRMCSIGQVVERRTYPGSHAGVIAPSLADMLAWIDGRLAGDPPPTSCPAP